MEKVALGVGITAIAFETARLLMEISKMMRDIRGNRAPDRCAKLEMEADKLKRLLRNIPGAINDSFGITSEAHSCMVDIRDYTSRMKSSGILDDALEVWWQKRYDSILARARRVNEALTVGLLARTDFNPLGRLGFDGKIRPVSPIIITEPTVITFNDARSTGSGTIEGYGDVICRRLKDSPMSLDALNLYQQLQDRSHVQQIRGLTELEGELYVVMQDCSSYETLNNLCAKRKLPLDLAARIGIAYQIARTFAWHHHSSILVKAASDQFILMKRMDKTFEPILTGLEHMRSLYERSTGLRFDCRYEAPEYGSPGTEHTLYTDRWCLGILAWQVICEGFPYGMENPVDSDDKDATQRIRTYLVGKEKPGTFSTELEPLPELVNELKACWNLNPEERPTPMRVATVLSNARVRLEINRNKLLAPTQQTDTSIDMLSKDSLEAARMQAISLVNQQREAHSAKEQQEKDRGKAKRKRKNRSKDDHRERDNTQSKGNVSENVISTALLPPPPTPTWEKIPEGFINWLVQAADAQSASLVGASIWWNLVDEKTLEVLARTHISDYLTITISGQRTELALSFLHRAARGGCMDGYFEMHLAYALLSNLCKDTHERTLAAMGSKSLGSRD